MPEEEEKKVSKFSSGINILQRLDQLWKNCHSFKRSGYYYRWNEELDTVWLELARDFDDKDYYDTDSEGKVTTNKEKIESKGHKSKFEAFDAELKKLMPFIDSGAIGFQKSSSDDNSKRNEQYKLLMSKQLFLARLENEIGKGTSWDESEDDWD